ncbi:MAG: hypothetical protein HN383_12130, partial [Verrucomicrobia bacterium]|nr:hypothetical protein [Verrucomicrobiota bacterium]
GKAFDHLQPEPHLSMLAVDAPGMPAESLSLHSAAAAHYPRLTLDFVPPQSSPFRAAMSRSQPLYDLLLVGARQLLYNLREDYRRKLIHPIHHLIQSQFSNFPVETQLDLYFHGFVRSFLIIPIGCRVQQQPKERTLFFQAGVNI